MGKLSEYYFCWDILQFSYFNVHYSESLTNVQSFISESFITHNFKNKRFRRLIRVHYHHWGFYIDFSVLDINLLAKPDWEQLIWTYHLKHGTDLYHALLFTLSGIFLQVSKDQDENAYVEIWSKTFSSIGQALIVGIDKLKAGANKLPLCTTQTAPTRLG